MLARIHVFLLTKTAVKKVFVPDRLKASAATRLLLLLIFQCHNIAHARPCFLHFSHSPLLPLKIRLWQTHQSHNLGLSLQARRRFPVWPLRLVSGQQPLLLRPWSNLSQHWVTSGRGGQLASSRQQSCEASSRLLSASIRGKAIIQSSDNQRRRKAERHPERERGPVCWQEARLKIDPVQWQAGAGAG